jgi:hypothetical protein
MALPKSSIQISIRASDPVIVDLSYGGERLPITTGLAPTQLEAFRADVYRGLNQFLNDIKTGRKINDFSLLSRALSKLHEAGRVQNLNLFGNNRHAVEKFFQRACRNWQRSGTVGYIPPVIQVTSRIQHSLPLEFLPLFDTRKPKPIADLSLLRQTVACFPVFSTIIGRVFINPDPTLAPESRSSPSWSRTKFENSSRLPVRFFRHAGLSGAKKERDFFERSDWIELRGPWPERSLSSNEFLTTLARQLWEEVAQPVLGQPDEIHHFACHCNTEGNDSLDHSLFLANMQEFGFIAERRAPIRRLKGEFGSYPPRAAPTVRPLVFLNACGSTKMTPNGITSFPEMFLFNVGNRGVIGTETRIPDQFAAEFSEQFYLNLVRGATLGMAVFNARWTLLKRRNNPLGLLYSVYANPYATVRKPLRNAVSLAGTQQ